MQETKAEISDEELAALKNLEFESAAGTETTKEIRISTRLLNHRLVERRADGNLVLTEEGRQYLVSKGKGA